jgi:Zn-dependent protease
MLFGSVFLHEMGHCRSARQVGGAAREVILWPLGGLASVDVPGRPLAHLAVAAGGPVVNLVLWLALLPFVISMDASVGSFLLWPAAEPITDPIAIAAAVNLDLLLFNLLPAFPLDGGRILHALVWQRSGEGVATRVAARSGKIVALALAVIWFISSDLGGLVLAIAVLIWIQSHQMQQMAEETTSSESWRGGTSSGPSWWQRQRDHFQRKRQQKKLRREQELRSRVDALLDKVSRDGIDSLSREERRFLDRASQRFEDR